MTWSIINILIYGSTRLTVTHCLSVHDIHISYWKVWIYLIFFQEITIWIFFHWIRIILSNKYVEFLIFDKKRNNLRKGALNPLDWSETHKIEIHPIYILPEPEIHPTCILPEPEYTWFVSNLPARTDRSNCVHDNTR